PYWLQSDDEALSNQVAQVLASAGATLGTGGQPSADAIFLITPLGEDCTAPLARLALPAVRTLPLDCVADLDQRRLLIRHAAATADVVAQARQALGADGVPVEVINDSPGFVIQRLIASVVNLGCEIAQKGIATPDTLDRAIQLALGYPKGPLGF